jgi:hypothetical protein
MSFAKVFSSLVRQLASGTPIYKITVPASIHTDKSALQVQSDQFMNDGNCMESYNRIDSLEDPIERIGCILLGLFNPHQVWITDKPFNPVQGEFISESTHLESGEYHLDVEQIWHNPPVTAIKLRGPTFTITIPGGLDPSGGVKPGLNHIEFAFPNTSIHFETKNVGLIEFAKPHIRIDNLIFGKRKSGIYGDWWVKDPSGVKFECKITMTLQIKGTLTAADGNIIDTVEGSMEKGLYFRKSGKLWIKSPEASVFLKLQYSSQTLSDANFSENVWRQVFKFMRLSPPDYDNADKEKAIVEQKQRDDIKARDNKYTSRFGFECKYMFE